MLRTDGCGYRKNSRTSTRRRSLAVLSKESKMIAPNAHYLLFCSTRILGVNRSEAPAGEVAEADADGKASDESVATLDNRRTLVRGRWHFVLDKLDGEEKLEVADSETGLSPDRLALLCIVRGLEALEQPSRVTLVTTSRYVMRGMRFGLASWRENDYRWERFGVQKPIRNADLWKRVNCALEYHGVDCRMLGGAENAAQLSDALAADEVPTAEIDEVTAGATSAQPECLAAMTAGKLSTVAEEATRNVARLAQPRPRRARATQEPAWKGAVDNVNKWWKTRLSTKPAFAGS